MDRRTPQRPLPRWPLGFIGMIGLLIVFETWLAIRSPDIMGGSGARLALGSKVSEPRSAPIRDSLLRR